uniref:ER membrane protein complex subunit 6 n=1 Tax=Neospora caninum (strain Liverpool) TaxID=572307 RepID=A0A0F7UBL5_NEOCL|nr:TPA: Rab5-interacting protein, putative [Neospora caninum Liverpool]
MDTRGVEPGVQLSDLASAAQSRKAVDALTAGDDASVPERPSTPSPGLASGEKAGKKESEAPPIRPSMVSHNYRQLTVNRHLAAVVAGSVAGIFGLEGLPGLFVFVLVTLLGGCLMVVETGFQCKLFFANTTDVFFAQFFTAALTFILIWTLVYNIVYIF